MKTLTALKRIFITALFLSLMVSCSKNSNPIVQSIDLRGGRVINEGRTAQSQPEDSIYFERIGPEELLNKNLKTPWTLDTFPTFIATLISKEVVKVEKIWAALDGNKEVDVKQDGSEFTIIPKYELKAGHHRIFLGVMFDRKTKPYGVVAKWEFEVLEKPPHITGVLEDEPSHTFYLYFDHEIDKEIVKNKDCWKLNGDSKLIEEVSLWDQPNWVMIKTAPTVLDKFNGKTDYLLNYDTGQGIGEYNLIPREDNSKSGDDPRLKGGECAQIIHDGDNSDLHFQVESEWNRITYEVVKQPDCPLRVD